MRHVFQSVLIVLCIFFSCSPKQNKETSKNERLDLSPPEPDKDLREKYEAALKAKKDSCVFTSPDTSVGGVKLLDRKSSIKVIGESYTLIEDNAEMPHIRFNSKDNKQLLTLFFHYGGAKNRFSEFQVEVNNVNAKNKLLDSFEFVTNSGIKLGITQKQLTYKLGKCFKTASVNGKETLTYRIADINSSVFLQAYNYPVYYANYEFIKNRLIRFRFGFEYP